MEEKQPAFFDDTIAALATPQGIGAIAVLRLSGPQAIGITQKVFQGKNLQAQPTHTLHFGKIKDPQSGEVIDEVLISLFKGPKSFTKEDVIEISTHGSPYIIKKVLQILIEQGARLARPGEFTKRAFINGQFDLAQAEAVADLIHADSAASHQAAMNQMRGGFSQEIYRLREQLIHFASMIELELDFGEEDVEFASRDELKALINNLLKVINPLIQSFDLGNVIKNGVPTVIAGKPNAGKSTLLNAFLNEEKAIVSEIAGTTRDFIEDEIHIEGVTFRFIDTAGIRDTTDAIESIGVKRTQEKMKQASVIIYLFDLAHDTIQEIYQQVNQLENLGIPFIKVGNKTDQAQQAVYDQLKTESDWVFISASGKENLDVLKEKLIEQINLDDFKTGNTLVTNVRHYESLIKTKQALEDVINGINNQVTNDFLAMDIRQSLNHLGEITGEITTDDLLGNIFSKFCIGK